MTGDSKCRRSLGAGDFRRPAYAPRSTSTPLLETDLAIFCNAGAPIDGRDEFERGVEEGKRRVWLHIARMRGLKPEDFVNIADGERL